MALSQAKFISVRSDGPAKKIHIIYTLLQSMEGQEGHSLLFERMHSVAGLPHCSIFVLERHVQSGQCLVIKKEYWHEETHRNIKKKPKTCCISDIGRWNNSFDATSSEQIFFRRGTRDSVRPQRNGTKLVYRAFHSIPVFFEVPEYLYPQIPHT